jgi:predicted Ser/Thr protein kinase
MATRMTIGKYEIIAKLAEGGMGAVYTATHPTLKRTVILKQLKVKGSAGFVERFKREARLLMDFRNEHVVQVYDHFKEGSSYFIVMEFIDGVDLDKLLREKRVIPNEMAVLIFSEICKALKYAHDKDVIHRDMKPANILVSREGIVKLVDFGIATSKDDSEEGLTRVGTALGTPAYMSPEQIVDTKGVDKRTDIYSMGVVLYEMVTGQKPFPDSFTTESIGLIQRGKYVSPRRINPGVSPLILGLIRKMMHRRASSRYQDLAQVIRKLSRRLGRYSGDQAIQERIKSYVFGQAGPTSTGPRRGKPGAQTREKPARARGGRGLGARIAVAAALVLVLALGLGFAFFRLGLHKSLFDMGEIGALKGLHYELLDSRDFGALVVTVKLPRSEAGKLPGETFIRAAIANEPGLSFRFSEDRSAGDRSWAYLRSQRVYLGAGSYFLQVEVERRLFGRNLAIDSGRIQKGHPKNAEFLVERSLPGPLALGIEAHDSASGRNMTGDPALTAYLLWDDRWIALKSAERWNESLLESLVAGKTYSFKFAAEGYYSKELKVKVEDFQDELSLDASLVPIPGTLALQSNRAGLEVLLNNSAWYLWGGEERRYQRIFPTGGKKQRLLAAPGDYYLTVKGPASSSQTRKVALKTGETVTLDIAYEPKGNKITISDMAEK